MPQFRDYSDGTPILPTDAVAVDRIGVGTVYVTGLGEAEDVTYQGPYAGQVVQTTDQMFTMQPVNVMTYIDADEQAAVRAGTSTMDYAPILLSMINDTYQANAQRFPGQSQIYQAGIPRLYFPAGTYNFLSTVNIKYTVMIGGDSTGHFGGIGTLFQFAQDVAGFIINRYNTYGFGTVSPTTSAADGTILHNLNIQMVQGTQSNPDAFAVWFRAQGTIRDCFFAYFPNHIKLIANAGAGGALEGNANGCRVENCTFRGISDDNTKVYTNDHVRSAGSDVNSSVFIKCNFSFCNGWSLDESSFLGNSHYGHEEEGSAFNAICSTVMTDVQTHGLCTNGSAVITGIPSTANILPNMLVVAGPPPTITSGNVLAGSPVITGIPSTAGLAAGYQLVAPDFTGVIVASVDSATQVTLVTASPITFTGLELQFSAPGWNIAALVQSVDSPTQVTIHSATFTGATGVTNLDFRFYGWYGLTPNPSAIPSVFSSPGQAGGALQPGLVVSGFTANSNGSTTLTNIQPSTTGIQLGMEVRGNLFRSGVPGLVPTYVVSIIDAHTITVSAVPVGTGTASPIIFDTYNVWPLLQPSAFLQTFAPWVSGHAYQQGGPYRFNSVANSQGDNPYSEQNLIPPGYTGGIATTTGNLSAYSWDSIGTNFYNSQGGTVFTQGSVGAQWVKYDPSLGYAGSFTFARTKQAALGGDSTFDTILSFVDNVNFPSLWRIHQNNGDIVSDYGLGLQYWAQTGPDTQLTFGRPNTPIATTGTVTSGSQVITGIPSTANLAANMAITGGGFSNAAILTINSGTQVTMSSASTVTAAGEAISFKAPAPLGAFIAGQNFLSRGQGSGQDSFARAFNFSYGNPTSADPPGFCGVGDVALQGFATPNLPFAYVCQSLGNNGTNAQATWLPAGIVYGGTTFGNLPASPAIGQPGFVIDSSVVAAGNFGVAVSGGGTNKVPVYWDGTSWKIG